MGPTPWKRCGADSIITIKGCCCNIKFSFDLREKCVETFRRHAPIFSWAQRRRGKAIKPHTAVIVKRAYALVSFLSFFELASARTESNSNATNGTALFNKARPQGHDEKGTRFQVVSESAESAGCIFGQTLRMTILP
jgi:hypothetical protein